MDRRKFVKASLAAVAAPAVIIPEECPVKAAEREAAAEVAAYCKVPVDRIKIRRAHFMAGSVFGEDTTLVQAWYHELEVDTGYVVTRVVQGLPERPTSLLEE